MVRVGPYQAGAFTPIAYTIAPASNLPRLRKTLLDGCPARAHILFEAREQRQETTRTDLIKSLPRACSSTSVTMQRECRLSILLALKSVHIPYSNPSSTDWLV